MTSSFFSRMRDIDVSELEQHPDALRAIYEGNLHGLIIRNVFDKEVMARVVERLEKKETPFPQTFFPERFKAWFYGRVLDGSEPTLNDYLREFRSKLEAHRRAQEALSISGDASPTQKTKALKEIEATSRQIEEVDAWERDVLFPLATQKIEIDLDDGVKANYPKFGAALKKIPGLEASE